MQTFALNPARSLRLMDIAIDLETVTPDTIIGLAIHNGLKRGSVMEVVKMILEQANDNYGLVCDIVGYKLMNKIEKL